MNVHPYESNGWTFCFTKETLIKSTAPGQGDYVASPRSPTLSAFLHIWLMIFAAFFSSSLRFL